MALPSWMKKENNKIIYDGDGEVIYYVPEKYFELSIAYIVGEYVECMGIFVYNTFTKDGKPGIIKPFKCPTMMKCKPSKIDKLSKFQVPGSRSEQLYRCLHFVKGDELMSETSIAQNNDNVDKFVNLFKGGNLPDYIPYNLIHEYMILNAQMNGFDYKVTNQIIGLLVSEIYRDANNLSRPFRYSGMKDMNAYTAVNISKVPKYTSVYTAITSENPDEAIASAIVNTGTGRSPLERIVMD